MDTTPQSVPSAATEQESRTVKRRSARLSAMKTAHNGSQTPKRGRSKDRHSPKKGAAKQPRRDIPRATGSQKRTDVLTWDEYFMSVAFLSAQRSKDPKTQVGACIVNKNHRIVGTGYNGTLNRCSDDEFPWGSSKDSPDILKTKKLYVCHAEMNAVLNKYQADLTGCQIYVTLFPCNECAKIIIQSGITKVIYYSDKYRERDEYKASRQLFEWANVDLKSYKPPMGASPKTRIEINFDDIDKPVE